MVKVTVVVPEVLVVLVVVQEDHSHFFTLTIMLPSACTIDSPPPFNESFPTSSLQFFSRREMYI